MKYGNKNLKNHVISVKMAYGERFESSPRYFRRDKDLRRRESFFLALFWAKCTLKCTLRTQGRRRIDSPGRHLPPESGHGKSQEASGQSHLLHPVLRRHSAAPHQHRNRLVPALTVTRRKLSAATKERPPKPGQDRCCKAPVVEAPHFEAITTAQIAAFISGRVASHALAPKTGNRLRDTLSALFTGAMKGESLYKISALMGNSPEICRRHYAALVPEAGLCGMQRSSRLNEIRNGCRRRVPRVPPTPIELPQRQQARRRRKVARSVAGQPRGDAGMVFQPIRDTQRRRLHRRWGGGFRTGKPVARA